MSRRYAGWALAGTAAPLLRMAMNRDQARLVRCNERRRRRARVMNDSFWSSPRSECHAPPALKGRIGSAPYPVELTPKDVERRMRSAVLEWSATTCLSKHLLRGRPTAGFGFPVVW